MGGSTQASNGKGWMTKGERELAIEKGCYHEEVPTIIVIMDGG